jgi:hypothetical protein
MRFHRLGDLESKPLRLLGGLLGANSNSSYGTLAEWNDLIP